MPFLWILERLFTYICSEYFILVYWYHCTVWIIRILLAFNASIFIFPILYVSICPHGHLQLICLCIIYIYIPLYSSLHLCYRLKSVAEERMVQGLWLHWPAVLPLGVSDDYWISPWGGNDDHLLLHSLNHLRPLLRHASPVVCLVSRFILYLLPTLEIRTGIFGCLR